LEIWFHFAGKLKEEIAGLALRRAGGEPLRVTLKPWLAKVTDWSHNNDCAKLGPASRWWSGVFIGETIPDFGRKPS